MISLNLLIIMITMIIVMIFIRVELVIKITSIIIIMIIIMIIIRVELVNHPYCNSGADQSLDRQTKICRPALWNEPIFIGRMMRMMVMTIMMRRRMMTRRMGMIRMMMMRRRRMGMTDKPRSAGQPFGMSQFSLVG